MAETVTLDRALARLAAALDGLETVVGLRIAHDGARPDVEAELGVMKEDRARLAQDLDASLARGRRLDAALVESGERIDRAMGEIRAVLDANPELG
ncbi:DUF4164 family protein [Terrarubrum flagellatum]|uniref:DUF4164 family protein n=1 Tax=Terrirubrum flagellatum TaxID=2895980 RepID=UPI003144D3AE